MAWELKPETPGVVVADSTPFAANLIRISGDFASEASILCGNEADTSLELEIQTAQLLNSHRELT